MKKIILIIIVMLLFVTGCKTQEEIAEEKEKQRIEEITKEVEKNTEVSEDVKKWLVDNRSKKVLNILCISTSKRCTEIKEDVKNYENKIKVHYIELDKIEEADAESYKTTYELKDYTGYLPYIYLVDNNKLIDYERDIRKLEDIKSFLVKNKIVSE